MGSKTKQPNNQPTGEQQNNTQPWMLSGGRIRRMRGGRTKAAQRHCGCDLAESNHPTINWLGYEKKTIHTLLGGPRRVWPGALPLLILCGPLVNRPGSIIVDDGTETNKTTELSDNQLWGTAEEDGDDHSTSLLV